MTNNAPVGSPVFELTVVTDAFETNLFYVRNFSIIGSGFKPVPGTANQLAPMPEPERLVLEMAQPHTIVQAFDGTTFTVPEGHLLFIPWDRVQFMVTAPPRPRESAPEPAEAALHVPGVGKPPRKP